jgi:hypothetical protein
LFRPRSLQKKSKVNKMDLKRIQTLFELHKLGQKDKKGTYINS